MGKSNCLKYQRGYWGILKRNFYIKWYKLLIFRRYKFVFWENYPPKMIGYKRLNGIPWSLTIRNLQRLNRPVSYLVLRYAYENSYKLWLNDKIEDIKISKNDNTELWADKYNFVKDIYLQEKNRQKGLEDKSIRLMTITGALLTISSLFSFPNLFSGSDESYNEKWVISGALLSFLLVWIAIVIFQANQRYARPGEEIIFKDSAHNRISFIKEKIINYYLSLEANVEVNNKKVLQLNIIMRLLTITGLLMVCFLFFFDSSGRELKPQKIEIIEPLKVDLEGEVLLDSAEWIQNSNLENIKFEININAE